MPLNLRLKPQGFSPGPKGQTAQVSLQGHKCPCSLRKAARMSIARMIGVWRSSNAIAMPYSLFPIPCLLVYWQSDYNSA